MKFNGEFTSNWDSGTAITTAAVLDDETGRLEIELTTDDIEEFDALIDEYFQLGEVRHDVCPVCHSYILKEKNITELDENGCELPEVAGIMICSDPYCESNFI